jgi:hypothetical protein
MVIKIGSTSVLKTIAVDIVALKGMISAKTILGIPLQRSRVKQ